MKPDSAHRCTATVRRDAKAFELALRHRGEAGLRRRLAPPGQCKNWALPSSDLCRAHSKLRLGPITAQGQVRSFTARAAGHARMVDELREAGQPLPGGRPRGRRNRTAEERLAAERDAAAKREQRQAQRQIHAGRRERKQVRRQQRKEAAELQRRHDAFQRGQPFWSDLTGGERAKDAPAPARNPEPSELVEGSRDDAVLQFSDWISALDHVERVMTIDRSAPGVRTLEKQFVDHLARGWLNQAEAERGYRLFMRFEELIARGGLAARGRRARLDEAHD